MPNELALPPGLLWYPHEPTWQAVAEGRSAYRLTEFELRVTRLGHVVRGGAPIAADRILATRLGSAAVETLVQERHGMLVGASRNEIVTTPLAEIAGRTRPADAALLELARVMAI